MTGRTIPWLAVGSLLTVAGAVGGCGTDRSPGPSAGGHPIARRGPKLVDSHVQVQLRPLGHVVNNGLRLPAVSPDGRYLALLSDEAPPERDGVARPLPAPPAHGDGPAMFLRIASLDEEGIRELPAPRPRRADWPAWSADGSLLAFVAGDGQLGIWREGAETTRRMDLSVGAIEMPAVSADGSVVAAVTARTGRLCLIDLADGRESTCSADANDRFVAPHWTPDGRVVVLRIRRGGTSLCQYEPPRRRLTPLVELPMHPSRRAAVVALTPIARPLSPDGRRFAWYDPRRDRISVVDIAGRGERLLERGLRAGCWLDAGRFVAAGQGRLVLCDGAAGPVSLMRGDWLPRGAAQGDRLICLSRGRHPGEFEVSRLVLRSVRLR